MNTRITIMLLWQMLQFDWSICRIWAITHAFYLWSGIMCSIYAFWILVTFFLHFVLLHSIHAIKINSLHFTLQLYEIMSQLISNKTDIYHIYCVDPGYASLVRGIAGMGNVSAELMGVQDLMCKAMMKNMDLMEMFNTDNMMKMVQYLLFTLHCTLCIFTVFFCTIFPLL